MIAMDQLLPGIIAAGLVVFAVLASFLVSTWQTSRQLRALNQDLSIRMRQLDDRIAEIKREMQRLAPGERVLRADQANHAPLYAAAASLPADTEAYRPSPSPASQLLHERQVDAAKAALVDSASFQAFVRQAGGTGHTLRGEAVSGGQDPVLSADLWAIASADALLVYPGFNLRRTQSSLVADAGRLAEERLGWLYEIGSGTQLGAARPARVTPGWIVIERGVLQVPF